jgi:hypothetical protein
MPLWATIYGAYMNLVFKKTTDPEHIKVISMLLRNMLQKQPEDYLNHYQSFWDNGGGMNLHTASAEGDIL